MTKSKETVISGIPLTAELFDAMFANKEFQVRLNRYLLARENQQGREFCRELKVDCQLDDEFGVLRDEKDEAVISRRKQLYEELEAN